MALRAGSSAGQPADQAKGLDRQLEKAIEVLSADVGAEALKPRAKLRKASERIRLRIDRVVSNVSNKLASSSNQVAVHDRLLGGLAD